MAGAAFAAPAGSLARCVGDVDAFLDKSWTRAPHLHERAGDDFFGDLLSLEHVDHIVSTMALRAPAFRLVQHGEVVPAASYLRSGTMGSRTVGDLPDTGKVFELFHGGATIVLQGLQRWWAPLTAFARELELVLTQPVQANAYVTPPGSQGLRVHHDTHDVFAMQTHGRKRWVTYEPVVTDPLTSQRWSGDGEDVGEPTLDVELHAGDCLYVPRGTLHAAATVEEASVHITVGVRSRTWHDVFRRLLERAESEETFRGSLPAGFANDPRRLAGELAARLGDLSSWVTSQDAGALADEEARRFWAGRQPVWDGQLQQLLAASRIDDDTQVERRPLAVCRLERRGDRLIVVLGDRRVEMPARVEPAVRLLVESQCLRVGELRDHLDERGRAVLVRRLVREGLLRVAS